MKYRAYFLFDPDSGEELNYHDWSDPQHEDLWYSIQHVDGQVFQGMLRILVEIEVDESWPV